MPISIRDDKFDDILRLSLDHDSKQTLI